MKILIAITCYNCQEQISRVLDQLAAADFLNEISHIAILDNRSHDLTRQVAMSKIKHPNLINKAVVYLNKENYGLGGSHKIAFSLAIKNNMNYVFILHGDDQAEVSDIKNFLNLINNEPKVSAVLGSRFSRGSSLIGYQKKRIYGNIALNYIYTFLTCKKTFDLGSGLNLFKVSELKKIAFNELSSDFTFNAQLLLSFYSLNQQIVFLPIKWKEEDQQSNARNFSVALRMLKALFFWKFAELPREKNKSYETFPVLND